MRTAFRLSPLCLAAAASTWGPVADNDNDAEGWWDGNSNNPYSSGSGSGGSSSSSSNSDTFGFPSSSYDAAGFNISEAMRYREIHGILAAVAFAALFPLGSIFMRAIPSGRFAWPVHALTQLLAYALYVAGAALGLKLVAMVRIPRRGTAAAGLLDMAPENAHPIIGIVLLALLLLQPALGWWHHRRFKRLGRRTWVSHLHLWIGRLGITLGMINGGLGLRLANAERGAIIAYSVVAGTMWLLWVLAAATGELRRRRKVVGESRSRGAGNNSEVRRTTTPATTTATTVVTTGRYSRDGPSPPYTASGPIYGGPPVAAPYQPPPPPVEMPAAPMKERVQPDGSDTVYSSLSSHHRIGGGQV
ncbi:hypothetical protein F4778DRAFT_205961 [Xylariomycetidae sp. FL2044]|nr:hypothetical protein F4778DRAFT_205961 [Xylariomycetidae sp. FL2044]